MVVTEESSCEVAPPGDYLLVPRLHISFRESGKLRDLYQSLFPAIATDTQEELARKVSYLNLKVESILQRNKLPVWIPLTDKEKGRLGRFGDNLGRALDELTTIAHPDTIRRWLRE